MKKFKPHYFILALIFISALALRLSGINKESGLWYDEMVIYSIGSKNFPTGMIGEDLHRFSLFPLYFLIYKCWIVFFGNSDAAIRLMSVFFDMSAVVCSYFVGTALGSLTEKGESKKQIGILNALLYSINSSFIYYSQEAKFYSLTFFLVNLLLLTWLKFLKHPEKKNAGLFLATNALLLYTFTSQLILIILLQLATFFYFYKKGEIKKHKNLTLGFFVVIAPLLTTAIFYKDYFSGNFDAVVYDQSFILLVLQNWFSPILTGLQNNILDYQILVLQNVLNLKWWIFIFFPVIFYLSTLIKGLKKELLSKLFLWVAIFYLIFQILLGQFTSYSVLVRYVMPVLPFVLLISAYGIQKSLKDKTAKVFLFLFLAVNLVALNSPVGATKIKRPDGYKNLANLLIENKIKPQNSFILPIRPSLLDKYYQIKGEKYSLYTLNATEKQKTYLSDKEIEQISRKQELYKNYKRFLLNENPTKEFETLIKKNYISKTSSKLVVITDLTICMYDDYAIKKIVSDENIYYKHPVQFLRLSKLNNDLIRVLSYNMRLKQVLRTGSWQVYVFEKYKNDFIPLRF